MVQHADAINEVELPAQCGQLHDVRLRVFDVSDAEFYGFSKRVSQAVQAEIDRQDMGICIARRDVKRLLARAASCDQNLRILRAFVRIGITAERLCLQNRP